LPQTGPCGGRLACEIDSPTESSVFRIDDESDNPIGIFHIQLKISTMSRGRFEGLKRLRSVRARDSVLQSL
jgi:hypothetical protein